MPDKNEILLDNAQHTIYSDEPWYLIVDDESGNIRLEGRFQSDAPDRTGFPGWTSTDYCVSKSDADAICRVTFASAAEFLAAERYSVIPEKVWNRAVQRIRASNKLT